MRTLTLLNDNCILKQCIDNLFTVYYKHCIFLGGFKYSKFHWCWCYVPQHFFFTQPPWLFNFFSTQPQSPSIFSWPNHFLFGPTPTINNDRSLRWLPTIFKILKIHSKGMFLLIRIQNCAYYILGISHKEPCSCVRSSRRLGRLGDWWLHMK